MSIFTRFLLSLYRDERGAEGLEKLLIIAAIVLPMLGLLIFFREELSRWVTDSFLVLRGENTEIPPP